MHTEVKARRLTKAATLKALKRAQIEGFLGSKSDDELAELMEAAWRLALETMEQVERQTGMTVGEGIVRRLHRWGCHKEILDFPVRGRRVRDWLPRSHYIPHPKSGRGRPLGYVNAPLRVEHADALGQDIPLGAKLSIGERMYEECRAEEARCSNDDTRVATLLLEAQLDMLKVSAASLASRGPAKQLARAERIEALADFFEMLRKGRRRQRISGRAFALLEQAFDWTGGRDPALSLAKAFLKDPLPLLERVGKLVAPVDGAENRATSPVGWADSPSAKLH
jgi:hypothetical protein